MVAYNFSPRFARLVENGMKRQTIRRTLRCKPGDWLQLFEQQRTKECRKLVIPDPICLSVHSVFVAPKSVLIDDVALDPKDHPHFARADGFIDLTEMNDWFFSRYGLRELSGFLIKW